MNKYLHFFTFYIIIFARKGDSIVENNKISVKDLSKLLKYMQKYRREMVRNSESDLRNKLNVRFFMRSKKFPMDYDNTIGDVIEIILTKKEYGYSNFEPNTHVFFFNHSIFYNVKNDTFSCLDNDPLAKRIIKHNQKELRTICKRLIEDNYLDKEVLFEVFNNGKVSISLNGDIKCESKKDKPKDMYIECEELIGSFKRAKDEYDKIRAKKVKI